MNRVPPWLRRVPFPPGDGTPFPARVAIAAGPGRHKPLEFPMAGGVRGMAT